MDAAIEAAVAQAVAEHLAWAKEALPSSKHEPRVMVHDLHGGRALRRPFKLRGHWRVRWQGTARLTNPTVIENGWTSFLADWSRP